MQTTQPEIKIKVKAAVAQATGDQASELNHNPIAHTIKAERVDTLKKLMWWWIEMPEKQRMAVIKEIWYGFPEQALRSLASRQLEEFGLQDISKLSAYYLEKIGWHSNQS